MLGINYPPDLPICARRDEIVAALRVNRVLIVAGETGSGKTTQLPKMCLDAGLAEAGKIGCTQPRRVAAMSVSRRVAEELGVTWGREVGCKMRFNDDTGRDTRVKFMTDGILLAEIQSDPMLRAYSALIIDEAHERSLNIDFLLGYLQGLLRRRSDLRVVITSATIDTAAFSKAFDGAPIIEVSGRLFPVEVRYRPIVATDSLASDGRSDPDEVTCVEAAARAAEDALIESDSGDVLVFMPTERDIRETCDLLVGSVGRGIEILPLFGRLSGADQQRIFAPGESRRVIVATNIAETSITIPRIGTVIDSGLARMSRYNPRTRTKRLPVEPVAQSSANQRAGRAGRVRDGVCVRLYSEDDFAERPRFTMPEIQRANLAEVILRMKAFRLGEVETFPFLDPPQAASIRAGYLLLEELGALMQGRETYELTPLGKELARLPVDPTLGRMLLQARTEGALAEVLVIAAGLSIPDPRERPEENKEAASAAHRAFAHPESDFLSLLNLWNAAPDSEAKGGRNALRRFCKANFLSQTRMREWRDVHRQLSDAMDVRGADANARREIQPGECFDAVHRAVLTGLLGQIAQRQERNVYKGSAERIMTLFPGSNVYERNTKKGSSARETKAPRQPMWIVAGEVVQTSQLFARNVARIDPRWVVELGAHLCNFRYVLPQWSARAGRVLVWERVLIHGLELSKRQIDHGRVNPVEATELFIRGALVAQEGRVQHRFFGENRKLRERIETALTRVRSNRVHDLDEAFYRFYSDRIQGVSSIQDLDRLVRSRIAKTPDFLCATETDLIASDELAYDRTMFPDQVALGNTVMPLSYSYTPGQEHDGVTVRVPLPLAERLSTGQLQWMVPGLRKEQTASILRALPKGVRKQLMPIEPKIGEIVGEFQPGTGDLFQGLSEFIFRKYGVRVGPDDWRELPDYLRPRVEVVDERNRAVATGRDLDVVRATMETRGVQSDAWARTAERFEKRSLSAWSFGDLEDSIVVEEIGGAPLLGFPGLSLRDGQVDMQLFRKRSEAELAAPAAITRLAELEQTREVVWLAKELRVLARLQPGNIGKVRAGGFDALSALGGKLGAPSPTGFAVDLLPETAQRHIIDHLFRMEPAFPLHEARYRAMLESGRRELPLLTHRLVDLTKQILELRHAIGTSSKRYREIERDVERLVPSDFLERTPHSQLHHLLRYLRAVQIRAERADVNPAKDAEKAGLLAPFASWITRVPGEKQNEFRWMLEEFRVSIFAQELGTAHPVSVQRLKTFGGI